MSKIISENSKEIFLSIAIVEFHKTNYWQFQYRKDLIKMIREHGYEKEAKELSELDKL